MANSLAFLHTAIFFLHKHLNHINFVSSIHLEYTCMKFESVIRASFNESQTLNKKIKKL